MMNVIYRKCLNILTFAALFYISSTQNINAIEPPEQKKLVIISCSGKSGSCTLEASFKALSLETKRAHALTDGLIQYILYRSEDTHVLFIDSIRDIMSRKISSYFQNLTRHLRLSQSEIFNKYKKDKKKLLHMLKVDFDKRAIEIAQNYSFNYWGSFGYNCLYDEVFDFNKKYQLKNIANFYFVNVRFADIKNWEQIFRSLDIPIDLSNFKIVPQNISQNKWYKEIYLDFLRDFTISQDKFNQIVENNKNEMAHFFTEEEIHDFFEKWAPYIVN